MNEKQLRDLLAYIDERRQALRNRRKKHMQALADLICPYKVGDTITIKGYAYTGKKGEVMSIKCRYDFHDEYEWTVNVVVLRKDGTQSLNYADWTQYEDEHCRK